MWSKSVQHYRLRDKDEDYYSKCVFLLATPPLSQDNEGDTPLHICAHM